MDIHKPKPVHNLREFLSEIGVVVCGIAIALAGEQTIEAFHWSAKVSEARASLRQELAETGRFFAFRVRTRDCVGRRLAELNQITDDVAAHRRVAPVGDVSPHLGKLIADDAWQAERASQSLTHFPRDEFDRFSQLYSQQVDMRYWVNKEIEAWAVIRTVEGDPDRLSASDLTAIRGALQQARSFNYLISLNAGDQIARMKALGISPRPLDRDTNTACAPLRRAPPALPYSVY